MRRASSRISPYGVRRLDTALPPAAARGAVHRNPQAGHSEERGDEESLCLCGPNIRNGRRSSNTRCVVREYSPLKPMALAQLWTDSLAEHQGCEPLVMKLFDLWDGKQSTPLSQARYGMTNYSQFMLISISFDTSAPQRLTRMDSGTAAALNDLKEHTRNRREEWSIFLGAGATADLGYPTMAALVQELRAGLIPANPEDQLIENVISALNDACTRTGRSLNIEEVLRDLYQLVDMLEGKRTLTISYGPGAAVDSGIANAAIHKIKELCKTRYSQPPTGTVLQDFLAYWMSAYRVLHIFTTNWDMAVEHACDEIQALELYDVRLCDGFKGYQELVFDSGLYSRTLPAEDLEDVRLVNLYKLHGSVDWHLRSTPGRGRNIRCSIPGVDEDVMIFPTPRKHGEILGPPYLELHRLFADDLERSSKYFLAVGTSFPDEHINTVVAGALRQSSFNLFVVNPSLTKPSLEERLSTPSPRIHNPIRLDFKQFTKDLSKKA